MAEGRARAPYAPPPIRAWSEITPIAIARYRRGTRARFTILLETQITSNLGPIDISNAIVDHSRKDE